MPGLTDSHIHPFLGSDGALGADLTGVLTLDGVLDALRAERARCGDGAWVRGYALAYEAFPDGGIDGRLIEEAVGGNPALLSFFDFHTALASPEALRGPAWMGRARSPRRPRWCASTARRPVSCGRPARSPS